MARRLFAIALVVDVAIACGDPSRIYQGRVWRVDRRCLDVVTSLDVVTGEPPGPQCGPICLAQGHSDGGRTVYAATMCGPYPHLFDAAGTDPECPGALAALARDDTCRDDGTSSNPPDAAADAE
ncbi:MAG: hypothetical protein KIT84_05655 [Labilithrix sp.]|nr:hypothetical protein [Labilithrix sp.]MCW5810474.1 hypothetical protein [Labilithrix sp.]